MKNKNYSSRIAVHGGWVLGLAACVLAPTAPAKEIELPPETAVYAESKLPGYALMASCLTCHSAEYVRTQPPQFARAYWQATVAKMQKTYGAPIPDTIVEPIVDYLVKTYGNERSEPSAPPPAPAKT